jgi:hypothetical protein
MAPRDWARSLRKVVSALRREEKTLRQQLNDLQRKLAVLEKTPSRRGSAPGGAKKHRLTPAGRAAIARAVKRRWARWRAQKKKATRR